MVMILFMLCQSQQMFRSRTKLEGILPPEPEEKEGMDHITGILEQLSREPKALPRVSINPNKHYNELSIEDFNIEGYDPHPAIRRTLAV